MGDEESEIYITDTPTEYDLSPEGNLRAGHPIGRAAYLSPTAVEAILRLKDDEELIDKTWFFESGNSQIPGGSMLYEKTNGELRLSANVVKKNPPFADNGSADTIDDVLD